MPEHEPPSKLEASSGPTPLDPARPLPSALAHSQPATQPGVVYLIGPEVLHLSAPPLKNTQQQSSRGRALRHSRRTTN